MNGQPVNYGGLFAAALCAFHDDGTLDEEGLRSYFRQLSRVEGLHGLVANSHTGEIMALRTAERARVTAILAEEVRASGRSDLIAASGVSAEGSLVGVDHALAAKEAGTDAILLMPPHHWLRFGRSSAEVIGYLKTWPRVPTSTSSSTSIRPGPRVSAADPARRGRRRADRLCRIRPRTDVRPGIRLSGRRPAQGQASADNGGTPGSSANRVAPRTNA